jgi:hypothetical protein
MGSLREMYWPSPMLISTLADSLPRRFLQTVAMTVPGSVAAIGDPFCELLKSWRARQTRSLGVRKGLTRIYNHLQDETNGFFPSAWNEKK